MASEKPLLITSIKNRKKMPFKSLAFNIINYLLIAEILDQGEGMVVEIPLFTRFGIHPSVVVWVS